MKRAENEKKLRIEEVAELYKKYTAESKRAAKASEEYKKRLIDFAESNGALFDGNTLTVAGVCIDKRETEKVVLDKEAVTVEWMGRMCDAGYGDYLNVEIDKGVLSEVSMCENKDASLLEMLGEVGFKVELKKSFVVRV